MPLMTAASPKPLSMIAQPSAASAVAMPKPMPLVDPVTTAALPFNIISNLLSDESRADRGVAQLAPRHDARQRAGFRHRVERLDHHLAGGGVGRRHHDGMAV